MTAFLICSFLNIDDTKDTFNGLIKVIDYSSTRFCINTKDDFNYRFLQNDVTNKISVN